MIKLLTAVVLGCCALLARAEPNIAKEYFPCQSCHGDEAEGSPAIHAPALAGQSPIYLARQLRNFQNGNRGAHPRDKWGAQMALMATNLAPGVIEPLSEYISQLPLATADKAKVVAEPAADHIFKNCVACHGIKGGGNTTLGAPRIAGLDRVYLATQLRNFRDGVRGSSPADSYGQQMRAALPENLDNYAIDQLARTIEAL